MSLNPQGTNAANRRDLDAWFTPGRFAGILGGLLALTFFNIISGLGTFYLRDFGVFTYPVAQYFRECFWRGELPLWNPLNYCGIPLVAQWNTSMLYPPSLFYLVFPLSWSLGVFNVAHLFWAGLGMYLLARRCLGNNFAASVAGVGFAFNGLSWHMLMWISNLAAWAWMPWVVLFLERAWREGGKSIAAAALAGAMQMLTGAPEIILMTWLLCGAMWAMQFWRGLLPRPAMAGRLALTGALVAGLSAVQLLPFLDLLKHSHRDMNYGDSGWAMPVSGLANFIEPLFHCFNGGHGIFVQYDQYWTSSYYLSGGVLLFAGIAVWHERQARVRLLAIAALLSVLLALGNSGGIYTLLRAALPQLGFMRYPIKFVVMVTFALPLLAAYGVSWAGKADAARQQKTLVAGGAVMLALLALIVGIERFHPMMQDDWTAVWHNAAVRAAFFIMIPAALAAMRRAAELKLQFLLRVALLLLIWMDVFTHSTDLSPPVARNVYKPALMREELKLDPQSRPDEPRVMQTAAAAQKVRFTTLNDAEKDYLCRRLSLYDNCNLLDDVPKIDGFYSLYLKEMAQVLGLIYDFDYRHINLKGLKDFLGVAHISATDSSPDAVLDWVSRTNYMPMVTAGQRPVFALDDDILASMAATNFDARKLVFLPLDARARVVATGAADAKVISSQVAAQKMAMEISATAPALVVIAQGFYHPWHASVDGTPAEVFRANYAFQAVQVPAGRHRLMLVYRDDAFHVGAVISLGAFLLCAVLWLAPGRARGPQVTTGPAGG